MSTLAERLRDAIADVEQYAGDFEAFTERGTAVQAGRAYKKLQRAADDCAALIAEVEQMERAVLLCNGLLQALVPVNDAILSSWVCATNWHEEDGREWLLLDPTPVRLYLAGNQADDKPLFQRAREALGGLFKEDKVSLSKRIYKFVHDNGGIQEFLDWAKEVEQMEADARLGALVRRMPELESGAHGGVHLSYRKDDPPFWHWWLYGQEGEPIPVASCADTPEECLRKALGEG